MNSRRVRRSLVFPSCFPCGFRKIQKEVEGRHFEGGSGVVPSARDPRHLVKAGSELDKNSYQAPTHKPPDEVNSFPNKPSTPEVFAETEALPGKGAALRAVSVQTEAPQARAEVVQARPAAAVSRASSISPFFPHGDTRQRADNNTGFPNCGDLARRVHSAVGGNMLSWLETADGAQLEDMCRAVAVGVDWADTHFQTARQERLDNVRKALSVDETSRRVMALDPLLVYTVEEHLRVSFEDIFHLSQGAKEMFRSSALKGLKARLVAEGLGPFVEDELLLEAVARDLVWITAGCALSGPPFHLSGEGIGQVEAYDGKKHLLVDGDAGPRVRVLFPAVPDLLPQSLCLPDEELRD